MTLHKSMHLVTVSNIWMSVLCFTKITHLQNANLKTFPQEMFQVTQVEDLHPHCNMSLYTHKHQSLLQWIYMLRNSTTISNLMHLTSNQPLCVLKELDIAWNVLMLNHFNILCWGQWAADKHAATCLVSRVQYCCVLGTVMWTTEGETGTSPTKIEPQCVFIHSNHYTINTSWRNWTNMYWVTQMETGRHQEVQSKERVAL
jgi:hypothetical protein